MNPFAYPVDSDLTPVAMGATAVWSDQVTADLAECDSDREYFFQLGLRRDTHV